ncbi:hypothetical protein CC80DRAFT_200531 [Byssothecium circinans]|uniref:Fungal N-terminal domain-containing protein n=1 Tax=Byssothecium circinans TaxID=147558 RepID=A0A6A5UG97_9PLEO|nr:hypothetical protein CC80DRAFT_200531 [Byssothecium circinans]
MAEVFGVIVGGFQIADSIVKVAKELRRCIRNVRYAPQEVQRFRHELLTFAYSLRTFEKTSNKYLVGINDVFEIKERKEHVEGIVEQCVAVKYGFEELLSRFFNSPETVPRTLKSWDRIRWYFRQEQVAGLRLSLESAKSSVMLFIIVHMYEDLVNQVRELEQRSQEVPKELWHQLKVAKRQLREQKKATRDTHEQLEAYFLGTSPSDDLLVSDISFIVRNTRSVEAYATRTLARPDYNVSSLSSSSRRRRSNIHRGSSPGPGLTVQRSHGPRRPPPAPSGAGNTILERTDKLRLRQPPQSTEEVFFIPDTHNEGELLPQPEASRKEVETSPQPSLFSDPGIVGPIIRDNGTELTETHGRWHREASQLSTQHTNSDHHVADTPAPLRRSKGKIEKIRPQAPSGNHSDGSGKQKNDSTASEVSGATQQLWREGASPYKAIPPWRDEDWKGVRRPPSS